MAMTLGDMCKSIRTTRRKSVTLRNTTAKVNDRPHIKKSHLSICNSDVFVYIN